MNSIGKDTAMATKPIITATAATTPTPTKPLANDSTAKADVKKTIVTKADSLNSAKKPSNSYPDKPFKINPARRFVQHALHNLWVHASFSSL